MIKPLVGIPMGDPAGIGSEIIIKALKEKSIYDFFLFFVRIKKNMVYYIH